MARRRRYADDAERQRAYRERKAGDEASVLRLGQAERQGDDCAPVLARPGAAAANRNGHAEHTLAAGLLVRVERELEHGRVLATVLAPGSSGLLAGLAYPFRVDLLREV